MVHNSSLLVDRSVVAIHSLIWSWFCVAAIVAPGDGLEGSVKEPIVISPERRIELVKDTLIAGRPLYSESQALLGQDDLAAVKKDWLALAHIKNPSEEMCIEACRQNGWALEIVGEQTEAICMAAVQQNGEAIQYVRQQTDAIALAAVQNTHLAIKHVENLTPEIFEASMVSEKGLSKLPAPEMTNARPVVSAGTAAKLATMDAASGDAPVYGPGF